MPPFDRQKSLQQLEGQDWGEPDFDSNLVIECHRLRRIPLREFTAENLRMMIGQQIGLPYPIPIALELLGSDPLAEGDLYQGDLIEAVLRVDSAFWREHPQSRKEMEIVARRAFSLLPAPDDFCLRIDVDELNEAYRVFSAQAPTNP